MEAILYSNNYNMIDMTLDGRDITKAYNHLTFKSGTKGENKSSSQNYRFHALEVCYENALYKFTFDIDI